MATEPGASRDDRIPRPDWSKPHGERLLLVGHAPSMLTTVSRDRVHDVVGVGRRVRSFNLVPVDVVRVDPALTAEAAAEAYLASGLVAYAEPNYVVHADLTPTDPYWASLWGMSAIHAPEAWDIATGHGTVVVGVIDTGVDTTHPDLATNLWTNPGEVPGNALDDDANGIVDDVHGARWLDGTGLPTSGDPSDDHGHGTHCAGTIGAAANNGAGVAGVIWDVQIMALKFIAGSGSGYTADAIAAVEYAVAEGARLTSNSWGGGGYSQALHDVIEAARDADQLFVAAAANSGRNTDLQPNYPSSYVLDNIISVGATTSTDQRASFSNYGEVSVDLGAPGVGILSTRPGNLYGTLSGTSMATPHVAGAAALLLDAHPGWTYAQVKSQILASAAPQPQLQGLWQTCGRLDLAAALGPELPPFVPTCNHPGPPAVLTVSRLSTNPTGAASVSYLTTFSESVLGADVSDFCLTTDGVTGAAVTAVTGTGTTRTVTVTTGSGDGTLRLDVCDDDTILDGYGFPLGGPGTGNGSFTSGDVYTLDRTKPTVVLTTPAAVTDVSPIPVTATFSEPVLGFVAADVTVTGATIGNFTPVSTSVYTFNLSPTVASGTLTARVLAGKCADAAANLNLASNVLSVLYDPIDPTVLASARLSPTPTNLAAPKFRVTFSESVTGVDTSDFVLTTSGVAGAAVTMVSGTGATRDVTITTGTGDGTVRLDLADDDTILDTAGRPLGGGGAGNGSFTAGQTYTVDKTRPGVVFTTPSPVTAASPIPVTASVSEPVTGFAAADLTVTGATVSNFVAVTSSTYTFDLSPTVASGTLTARVVASKFADSAANVNLASNVLSVLYDPIDPTVIASVRLSASPTNLAAPRFRVTFSEAVTGVDASDLVLETSGLAGAAVTQVTGTGAVRDVTIATGTGDGTVRLDVLDDGTIVDLAGRALGGPGAGNGGYAGGQTYVVDKTKPSLVLTTPSAITGTAPVPVTATFSEPVTGFVAADVTVTGATLASFTAVSASEYTFVLNPTVPSGTLTARVLASKCVDAAVNYNLASNVVSVLYDPIDPSVVSVVRLSADPTNLAAPKFRVTFNEPVTGVDVGDFVLDTSGLAGAAVTLVSGTGATRDVTVSTGTGDGTARLDLVDDDTILDLAGRRLGGPGTGNGGFSGGQTYTVDKTKPSVLLTTAASDPTSTSPIPVTASFSEPVTQFVAADVTVTNGSVTGFAGSGALYDLYVAPAAAGSVTVRAVAGVARDAAGNTSNASNVLVRVYQP